MALTPQEETALKALVSGMSQAELESLKISGQKQQVADLRARWLAKKSALTTADGNYLAALNDLDVALETGDTTKISAAKTTIQTARTALVAALEAAK